MQSHVSLLFITARALKIKANIKWEKNPYKICTRGKNPYKFVRNPENNLRNTDFQKKKSRNPELVSFVWLKLQ